jgi:PLD-like domain
MIPGLTTAGEADLATPQALGCDRRRSPQLDRGRAPGRPPGTPSERVRKGRRGLTCPQKKPSCSPSRNGSNRTIPLSWPGCPGACRVPPHAAQGWNRSARQGLPAWSYLPVKPKGGGDDTRGALAELIEADDDHGRVLGCCLFARAGRAADPIYVHAKIGIVDDRWLTIGSANLNDHSLFNDTELNLVTHDPELARRTRLSLWAEHLECQPGDIAGDPAEVIDGRWRPTAEDQLRRQRRGEPLTHRLMLLDHVSRRAARLLGPLQGLLVDG